MIRLLKAGAHARARNPILLAIAGALTLALFGATGARTAPLVKTDNIAERAAIADFDEEHAHLADELDLTATDLLVLAALPKGSAYVRYNAPSKCVPGALKAVLSRVSKQYGPIVVNSTYRSKAKNRRVGGKSKSFHLSCRAIDFRVHGKTRGLLTYLRKQKGVGGVKRYRSGFYHIDNGPRRSW